MKNALISLILLGSLSTFMACSGDDSPAIVPPNELDATFLYTIDSENPNTIRFTANPQVATWYTH